MNTTKELQKLEELVCSDQCSQVSETKPEPKGRKKLKPYTLTTRLNEQTHLKIARLAEDLGLSKTDVVTKALEVIDEAHFHRKTTTSTIALSDS